MYILQHTLLQTHSQQLSRHLFHLLNDVTTVHYTKLVCALILFNSNTPMCPHILYHQSSMYLCLFAGSYDESPDQ